MKTFSIIQTIKKKWTTHRLVSSEKTPNFIMLGSLLFLLTELAPLCNNQNNLNHATTGLEQTLQQRRYNEFLNTAEKNPWYSSSNNKLLLNLDTGIAEVFNGNFSTGRKKLISVGKMSEGYYTKSITLNILSVLTNDLTLPYYGEDYELVFAGSIAALAYAASGDIEDALVEARLSEHRLNVMSTSYEGKKKYSDDAFAHYLAGMLFEADGNYNDAVVSYKRAYNSYGGRFFPDRPEKLTHALIGASIAGNIDPGFGFQSIADTLKFYDKKLSLRSDPDFSDEYIRNTMIFIAFTGKGPKKVENILNAHFTDEGVDYLIKIALPDMVSRESSIASVRFRLDNGEKQDMELAADYNHIGVNAFKDKRNFLYAKTVARVSARYLIFKETKDKALEKLKKKYDKEVEENGKDSDKARNIKLKMRGTALAIDLLSNELLEQADTRHSLALPGNAFVARVPVLPDSHHVQVEYLDRLGNVLDTEKRTINFEPESGFVELFTALF
ncbi:hypothetical protein ACFL60_02180 [Candidatus Omnitrophota bacterium]